MEVTPAASTSTIEAPAQTATNPASMKANQHNWVIVGLLLAFFTLNFADKAAIGLAAAPIRDELELSASQYGLLGSAFFWLFAVGAVVLALAFKWIGYKWSAALLMIAWVISMAPLTVPTTFGVLLAARISLGFFEGPAHALCQSVVADRFPPERRAFAGAVVNAGSSVGPLIAAPALTWVILTWSWHLAFSVLCGLGLLWTVIWLFVGRHDRRDRTGSSADQGVGADDPNGDVDVPFTFLLRLGSFWGLAALSFAGYLISSLKVAWLPLFLQEGMGYSAATVGSLVTIPYACAIVVLLTAGLLSGRMLRAGFSSRTSRGLLTMGYLLFAGVCMMTFTRLDPGPVQLVLVVAAFSINSVAFSIAFAGAADFLPRQHRVGFFGCIIAAYSIAGIVAPYGLGVIVDAANTVADGYANGFLVVGFAICLFAVVGGLLLDPARSRRRLLEETARRSTKGGVA